MALSRLSLLLLVPLLAAQSARAADPHLPADTQAYASINLRKVFDSELFKTNLLEPAREALKAFPDATDLLTELGLDPFKDIDRLILSSPLGTEQDRGLLIVHGSFSEVKLKARAAKLKKEKDDNVKVHEVPLGLGVKHDVYEILVPGVDVTVFVALATPKVILVSPGKDYIIDALKHGRTGKPAALKNKELQALIEALDAKQALTVAAPGKVFEDANLDALDILPGKLGEALKNIVALGGGLTIGETFKLELAITTKDAENAKALRETVNAACKLALAGLGLLGNDSPELELVYDLVKSIKVTGKGKVVSLTTQLTAEALRDLFGPGG